MRDLKDSIDQKMEQDFTELSVQVSNADEGVQKSEIKVTDIEEVQLLYKPPRLFRKSLIFKTLKLFGAQPEPQTKFNRPIKEQ